MSSYLGTYSEQHKHSEVTLDKQGMASQSQDSKAEAGIGAGAIVDLATTVPVTPSGNDDAAAGLISGRDASIIKPSSPGTQDETGSDAVEASHGKRDPVVDDQSQVLSRIKKLQDELVKVERSARLGGKLESVESEWDSQFERFGGDVEQRNWTLMQQMRAQSFVKDTTAFAFGREWAHESEDNFIWSMLERENQDKQLVERRAQWEAKKEATRPKVDDSLKPTRPEVAAYRSFQLPAFLDPLSDESRYNDTLEAKGYDQQERLARSQIHEIVRQKHDSFMRWRARPRIAPPLPDTNAKAAWPRPVVGYVEWKVFRYCSPAMAFQSEEKKDLFAVDVLDGEPDISVSRLSYDLLMRKMRNDGSQIPTGIPKMAHGLVPERIRLNGPQFPQILGLLGGDENWPFFPPTLAQMVLLQPYRLLVYYDQHIRNRHSALKERLEASGGHEEMQSDTEQVNLESIDAGTQSSRKGETGAQSGHQPLDATQRDVAEDLQQQSEDKLTEGSKESNYPLIHTKTALAYLECLIDFMDTTVCTRRNYIQGPECRKIHFRDLWYLFNPGDEVVRRDEKQVYRVVEISNPTHTASSKNTFFSFDDKDSSRYFQVSCVFVDFDGKEIGPVSTTFTIKAFAGERSVESLEVYPLRLHRFTAHHERKAQSTSSTSQTLRQQLIKRGKKFFQAASMKLENTFYDGPTANGDEVESQVVVDFETALSSDNNFGEDRAPKIKSLLGDTDDSSSTSSDGHLGCIGECCDFEYVFQDFLVDEKRKEDYIDSLIPKNTYAKLPSVAIYPRNLDDTTGDNALTDDEFLLMSYRVFAFVLRTRKWGESCSFFLVDLLLYFNPC